MKQRWKLRLALLVLFGSLAALPALHWPVIGLARGEAFYQQRPTSWWREECRLWNNVPTAGGAEVWVRQATGWQQPPGKTAKIKKSIRVSRMPLLQKDIASLPVLLALLDDKESRVLNVALHGLGILGPDAAEAVPTLLDLFRGDSDSFIHDLAGQTLWRIDPKKAALVGVKDPWPTPSPRGPRIPPVPRGPRVPPLTDDTDGQ